MRRLIRNVSLTLITILLIVSMVNCKRKRKSAGTQEEEQGMASMVHVADPRTSAQLVRGFHAVEQNAWRWTMAKFTVVLKPPAGAATKGATLLMNLVVPDPVINRLTKITLTPSVDGVQLAPETYSKTGDYVLTRDIPASAFKSSIATVDFALDHALPPGDPDQRELGIIVNSVGLEAK